MWEPKSCKGLNSARVEVLQGLSSAGAEIPPEKAVRRGVRGESVIVMTEVP